jgi:hypothetical protein
MPTESHFFWWSFFLVAIFLVAIFSGGREAT